MATSASISISIEFTPTDCVTITWEEHYGRWHASEFDTVTGEHTRRAELDKFTMTGCSYLMAKILDHPESVRDKTGIVPGS